MKKLYTAEVVATGGREGHVSTPDQNLSLSLSKPVELGGSGEGTNPEQLLAAGWAACFLSALKMVGTQERVNMADAEVTVRISFNSEKSDFFLSAEIDVHIPDLHIEDVQHLTEKANKICPFSKATHGNIENLAIAL